MQSSQRHPKSPGLDWQIAIPRTLILFMTIHFVTGANFVAAQQLRNVSIPITSPQIVYTPFVCNASTVLANPQSCAGAWQLSNSLSRETISSTGPSSASGNIIPQMFFEFQASSLFLTTVRSSNASVNLTLSAGGIGIWAIFNSSLRSVSIVNLPQTQTTLLTITYIPAAGSTRFDLQSLVITIPANVSTSSVLPTPTLPPSASLPTFIPTSSSSSATPTVTAVINVNSNKKMIAQAVGITIGLGLGLTVLAVTVYYYWKRRRHRLEDNRIEKAKSEWNRNG